LPWLDMVFNTLFRVLGRQTCLSSSFFYTKPAKRLLAFFMESPHLMNNTTRHDSRAANQLRPLTITRHYTMHAEGAVLIACGNTKVLCTASVEERVPPHKKGSGEGWVTAEYGMLPRSTHDRMSREAAKGKQSGRTQEIQRLIGRSLRAVFDLKKLGERTITLDCDVLQADGGTRTASITGAFVAASDAVAKLLAEGKISQSPLPNNRPRYRWALRATRRFWIWTMSKTQAAKPI